MQVLDFVIDAVTAVQSWGLSDEVFSDAVNAQACLMAGLDNDDVADFAVDVTVH